MSNVIRPSFGGQERAKRSAPSATGTYVPLRVFGDVAGYAVASIRDEAVPEGPVVRIVVGALTGNEVEAVAKYPFTVDAEAAAFAILRTLELVAARRSPPEPA